MRSFAQKDWIYSDPTKNLRWKYDRHDRDTLDVDLVAVEALLTHLENRRQADLSDETARDRLVVQLAVDIPFRTENMLRGQCGGGVPSMVTDICLSGVATGFDVP
jgi:hypothetical protein